MLILSLFISLSFCLHSSRKDPKKYRKWTNLKTKKINPEMTTLHNLLNHFRSDIEETAVRQAQHKAIKRNRRANKKLINMALMTQLGYDVTPFLNKKSSTHIVANYLAKLY